MCIRGSNVGLLGEGGRERVGDSFGSLASEFYSFSSSTRSLLSHPLLRSTARSQLR